MSHLTNFAENKLVDFTRGQALTLPADWHLALGSSASDLAFTELSGSGYARQPLTRSLANFAGTQAAGSTLASTGTSHATSNNVAVSWGNPAAAWGTASWVGFFDASTGGNCWFILPIAPVVITTGSPNPVEISIGALEFTFGLLGGCSDYLANKLIDLLFRAQAFTWPANVYQALQTVAGTAAGGGTEVSGGAYARVAIPSSLAEWSATQSTGSTSASSGTGGRSSNNNPVQFPTASGSWGTVVASPQYDASSAGNLLFTGALGTPKTVGTGAAPQFPADSISRTFA